MRLLFLFVACACVTSLPAAQPINGVLANVDGNVITWEDVNRQIDFELLEKQFGRNRDMFEAKLLERQKEQTEYLVERQLILSEFRRKEAAKELALPESYLEDIMNQQIRSVYGDRITLTKTLKAQGRTFEQFRQELRERIIINQMEVMNIDREIVISPHKIENYYVHNRDKFKVGDQVKLRMIVLNQGADSSTKQALDLARQIRGRIKDVTTFSEMAGLYSDSPQKTNGGDYGWVEQNFLIRGLSDVAFELESKTLSPVVGVARLENGGTEVSIYDESGERAKLRKYDKGGQLIEEVKAPASAADPREFYLLMVEDKRVAFSRPLAEVQAEIEKTLKLEEERRLRKQFVDRLKKKSFVRYYLTPPPAP